MVSAVNLVEKHYSQISGREGSTFSGFCIHRSALIFTLESADS